MIDVAQPYNVYEEIPPEFYRESWEDADYPLACVSEDNKFLRVNSAFERMLGFSTIELEGTRWTNYTAQEHVGGDLASVEAVLEGRLSAYTLEKDYVHKRGHKVPITLTVRRYPRNSLDPVLMFRVEAPITTPTRAEIDSVEKHALEAITQLKEEIARIKQGVIVTNNNEATVGDKIKGHKVGGDLVGTHKNDAAVIKYMIWAIVALGGVVSYMAYYVSTTATNTTPEPPQINAPKLPE